MPDNTNYDLRWDSFKANITCGFAKLQMMQEFVDVTLAADRHLVGAHQNVLALASPYLKELLKSAPCRHPIIFLGPINHTVLVFILEFIYTGEVKIPGHVLPSFIEACKMLHITAVKDIEVPQTQTSLYTNPQEESSIEQCENIRSMPHNMTVVDKNQKLTVDETIPTPEVRTLYDLQMDVPIASSNELIENVRSINTVAHVTFDEKNQVIVQPLSVTMPTQYTGSDQDVLTRSPEILNEIIRNGKCTSTTNDNPDIQDIKTTYYNAEGYEMETDFENLIKADILEHNQVNMIRTDHSRLSNDSDDDKTGLDVEILLLDKMSNSNESTSEEHQDNTLASVGNTLFTKSDQGNLIMILNRRMYYCHHKCTKSNRMRWRCSDYRKNKCRAFVDTHGGHVVIRANEHNHDSFHDIRIMKLGKKRELFKTIEQASKYT